MRLTSLSALVRSLRRHPVYTGINVVGLTVALAACLLIGLYTAEELRYDAFHENADRIQVLAIESDFFGRTSSTSYPMGETLRDQSPRVEEVARINDRRSHPLMRPGEKATPPMKVLYTEASFARVFSFPVVRGDLEQALTEPGSIALTASTAERLFGDGDALGQPVLFADEDDAGPRTVRAIVADAPEASTIQFDALRPLSDYEYTQEDSWGALMYRTFVLLERPEPSDTFLAHATAILEEAAPDKNWAYAAVDFSSFYLSDLYQASGFRGQQQYLSIFGIAALLVLLLAGINYVNLATLQGQRRAREIAVHKTMGASRSTLAGRFLGESVLLAVGAAVLALALATLLLPAFNEVMSTELSIRDHGLWIAGATLGFGVVVGLAAGAYPGVAIARFRPATVFRRHGRTTTNGGGWLHRGLITLQFAVSVVLIASTAVIYQQLDYVQTKNLGFQGEQVAVLPLPSGAWDSPDVVRQRVRQHPSVQSVTLAAGIPGQFRSKFGLEPEKFSPDHGRADDIESVSFMPALVDAHYVETLGMEVVAGRSFDPERPSDETQAVMLNERGAQEMGWTPEEAVGKPFSLGDRDSKVIGVVRDFHQGSLHTPIEPVILQMHTTRNWGVGSGQLAARLAANDIPAGVDHIREQVSSIAPSAEVEVDFLDDAFDAMYRSEQRLSWLFTAFAIVAIVIACLGLYGLAAHAVQQRTKEIGIRKALGATVAHIIGLVTREYALLIGIALVVGAPIAYVLMQGWLQEFAYRVEVGATPFTVTAVLALGIASFALGGQVLRAARLDPATTLRDE